MAQHRKSDALPHRHLLLIRALLAAALLISLYLGWMSLGGGAIAGCGPESACDKVLHSRWSRWFGVPVSVPAVLLYTIMLATTLRLSLAARPDQQRNAWTVLLPCAWVVLGAVVWFAALQLLVIKAVCLFCMAAHACGLVAALLILFSAPVKEAPEKPWQREKEVYIEPKRARGLIVVGLVAVAVLSGGQVLIRRGQFNVTSLAGVQLQRANRSFHINGGRFVIDMNEAPLVGSPAASHAIVSLFDYTCHHCRIMHGRLKEVQRTFADKLAIISLPMPLDRECNYTVRMTPSAHTNACKYALLGLAVWRANREKHSQFDDWVFAPEHPPDLPDVRGYAAQLVGEQNFATALTNDWVGRYLETGVNIYATNYLHARRGQMPQLIIGTNLITGVAPLQEVYRQLDQQLGLRATNLVSQAQ